jgi:hypothetical protein
MNTQEPRRIDRRTAEYLLGQAPIGIRDGHPTLAALLSAAAVPGRPDELAREQTSMAAFRTAGLHPVPRPRSLSVVKSAVVKVLTVKAIAVLATTTAGGVALAASTGTLPNPLGQSAPAASSHSRLSAALPTASQSAARYSPGDSPKTSKNPEASTGPSPSLVGLCHAYSAGNKAEHGKALDNSAFTVLITTAGGKDKVGRFCQALLAAPTPANSDDQHDPNRDKHQHGGGRRGGNHDDNDHTGGPANQTAQPSATPKP